MAKFGMKNRTKGKLHEVKGKIKQKVGRITNSPKVEFEGAGEKVAGKVQKKVGQAVKFFGK